MRFLLIGLLTLATLAACGKTVPSAPCTRHTDTTYFANITPPKIAAVLTQCY